MNIASICIEGSNYCIECDSLEVSNMNDEIEKLSEFVRQRVVKIQRL